MWRLEKTGPADLVFDPTLACRELATRVHSPLTPSSLLYRRQDLPLSRTVLSNH